MGEICKDPQNEAQTGTIEETPNILKFLIQAEGAAAALRAFQYALEDLAGEIAKGPDTGKSGTAAKYLKASEAIESAYWIIRNEIRI